MTTISDFRMPGGEDNHETESAPIRESISSLFKRVVAAFSLLQTALREAGSPIIDQVPPSAVEDELARFRLWAGNAGAHRKGRVSLDHKLRFATHLHDQVTDFLRQLIGSLDSGKLLSCLSRHTSPTH